MLHNKVLFSGVLLKVVFVFFGGAIGSLIRFSFVEIVHIGNGFPAGILLANLLACFVLGVAVAYLKNLNENSKTYGWLCYFVGVGVCGGLSTMSGFINDVYLLSAEDKVVMLLSYIAATIFGGFILFSLPYMQIKKNREFSHQKFLNKEVGR